MLLCVPEPVCQTYRGILRVEHAGDGLLRGLDDRVDLPLWQPSGVLVKQRGGLLRHTVSAADLDRHAVIADGEVDERPLRLRTPVTVGGNFDLPMPSNSVRVPAALMPTGRSCNTVVADWLLDAL